MNKEKSTLMEAINSKANEMRKELKEIAAQNKELEQDSEFRIRDTQQTQLTKSFIDVMNEYQKLQSDYKEKQKKQLERQFLIVKPKATAEELQALQENAEEMLQSVFSLSPKQEARKQLQEMKARNEDIEKLESSLLELNQLFVDMSILVEQQGDLIDQIDFNVSQAVEYTEKAKIELQEAVTHQKKAWCFRCLCCAWCC